jgi:uncharacterized protein (TIGR03000 family)
LIPVGGEAPLGAWERETWEKYVSQLDFADRERVLEAWAKAPRNRQLEMIEEARKILEPPVKAEPEKAEKPEPEKGGEPPAKNGADKKPETNSRIRVSPTRSGQPLEMLPDPPSAGQPAPARLLVELPAEAQLLIDGRPTRAVANRHVFNTPPLSPDRTYEYSLEARFVVDGQTLVVNRTVAVRAGRTTRIRLSPSDTSVVHDR